MSCSERRARGLAQGRPVAALAAAAAALALSACDAPAGRLPEADGHGYSNAANLAAMRGEVDPARLAALAAEFQTRTDPVVTFDFDRAELDPSALAALEGQAAWLKAHPSALVAVTGHADLVGGSAYNQGIGLRRAAAAAKALSGMGVASERLLLVASRGEREPAVPTEGRERRNRRVVTTVEGMGSGWDRRLFDGKRAMLVYTDYTADRSETVLAVPTTK